jgi:hypothetical protein
MPEVIDDLRELPTGSHALSFHASRQEAVDHAVGFLAGAPPGQATSYWVPEAEPATPYVEKLNEVAPGQVGCVRPLHGPQVVTSEGRHLRPTEEIRRFVTSHPEGVTAGAETITTYWSPQTVPDYLEYEAWFQDQPRNGSRFVCPYDLRRIPASDAPQVMMELGAHHSHVVLSTSDEPAVRILQLFVFATPAEVPIQLQDTLEWAKRAELISASDPNGPLTLTPLGESLVQEWSEIATVNW